MSRHFHSLRWAVTVLVIGGLPIAVVGMILATGLAKGGPRLYDFRGGLYAAGKKVAQGQNRYRSVFLQQLADKKRAGGKPTTVFSVPVYPAPALVVAVPFGLLPYRVAATLFYLLSVAALLLSLRLVGVSDWRCYGLALASWPVVSGLVLGALTPLLALGTALVWRYRDSSLRTGLGPGDARAAKLLLWPLGVWLIATRRYRAALLSVVLTLAFVLAAWSLIGFAGLSGYPRLLGNLSYVEEGASVSLVSGLLHAGLSAGSAHALALVAAAALLVVVVRLGPGNEQRAFALAMVAALLATPMVWPHYLALLFVPIGVISRRLSALWFLPLLAWLAPYAQTSVHRWAVVPYLGMILLLAITVVRLRPEVGEGSQQERSLNATR